MTVADQPRFQPGRGLTVATLVALAILIVLGTWQARKVGPKTARVAELEAGLAAPPAPLHRLESAGTLAPYRRVTITGRFMDTPPIAVFGTNLDGEGGYHLYLPFLRDGSRPVLVSPGWVADRTAPVTLPTDRLTVTGVLRRGAQPGPFTPVNQPESGDWFTARMDEMADHFGLARVLPYRVILQAGDWTAAPLRAGQVRVQIRNNHLEYALTWYGLGLALVAVYLAYGLARARRSADPR
ncbi:SURF1 family protein [Yunchengibacter salinarum]|uniref:SURF1 family protein n=1 Tax=Yunchengibacter salinarum TaxID=3133399 RepID=UPI0035B588F8